MGIEENYRELSIAIIKQAAIDWTKAAKTLRRNKKNEDAKYLKEEAESFFRSAWCFELGGVDGRYILTRLQEEIKG